MGRMLMGVVVVVCVFCARTRMMMGMGMKVGICKVIRLVADCTSSIEQFACAYRIYRMFRFLSCVEKAAW